MKKILFLAGLVVMSYGAFAQDSSMPMTQDTAGKMGMMKNYLTMDQGKLMMMKDGMSSLVTSDKKLMNGTVVKTDGSIMMKNGMKAMLMDGDKIFINGQISRKMGMMDKKDSTQ